MASPLTSKIDHACRRQAGPRGWRGRIVGATKTLLILAGLLGALARPEAALADPVPDYNLAVQFYKQKQWQRSASACEDFLKNYPDHKLAANARLYWGQALVQLQKFREARQQFRDFLGQVDAHPDEPLAMYRVGECSYFLGEHDAARDELTAYLEKHSDHSLAEWAWIYLADSLLQLKNARQAIAVYEAYLDRFPSGQLRGDAEFGLAKAYEANGNPARAVQLYERAAANPDSTRAAQAQFNLGAVRFDAGEYTTAAAAFDQVAARFPKHPLVPLAQLNAGYAFFHQKEFESAIERFALAAASEDHQSTAQFWTGLSYKALGDYGRAVEVLASTYRSGPDQPQAEELLFHWADSALRAGRFEESIDLFRQLVQRWPDGELADDALYSACDAAFLAGDLDGAGDLYARFSSEFPESPLSLAATVLQGRILIAEGDALKQSDAEPEQSQTRYRRAAEKLKEVVRVSQLPRTVSAARLQLARAYERLGEYESALAAAGELLASPEGADPELLLDAQLIQGNSLLQLQRYAKAAATFEELLARGVADGDPLGPPALAGLAIASAQTGDWSAASSFLDRLQKTDRQDRLFSRTACRIGELAFQEKNWPTAAALFGRVVKDFPGGAYHLIALSNLGHARYEMKQYAEAATSFAELAEAAGEDAALKSHALHMQGLSMKLAGRLADALAVYQQAFREFKLADDVSRPPTQDQHKAAWNAYQCAKEAARTASELDQYETADRLYESAYLELKKQPLESQGELDKLVNEWAGLSYNRQKYARSDEVYAILIKERPGSPLADEARLVLAESAFFADRVDQARAAFEELAADADATPYVRQRSLTLLLDIDARRKDWESVLRWARQMNAEFPQSDQQNYVDFRAGEALLNQGDADRAADRLGALKERLVQLNEKKPNWWPEVWVQLAGALLKERKYDQLSAVVSDLRERAAGTDAEAVVYKADLLLGRSLERQARFDEARQAYERVISSTSGAGTATAAEAQFRIAESHMKQKNYEAAVREYYKVYVGYSYPDWQAPSLYQAALCDRNAQNWEAAATTYETLLKEFPDSTYAARARSDLQAIQKQLGQVGRPNDE